MDLQQEQACWKLELDEVTKFDPSKKKKKKKNKKWKPLICEDGTYDILFHKGRHFAEDNSLHCRSGRRLLFGHNFEPDYGYEELLTRVFDMLREDDLEVSTERPRTAMMPPLLRAQGTLITVCLNFVHLCRMMHRKPGHVMKFLLAQMETKGLLNKQQQLEMKGLVSSSDFQAVFRRYSDAFVICSCCKSPDTALAEENGLLTLRCEMCGLVASIKEPNPL
ncbi:hypothetical protein EUTSA_v10014626mg [Eutrema salsugineum]|uniref:Eukaryotic translation initiation factor 2 subunit beta n=1 Tax=Eutrema salsugineum TaxID=72664 RepID=V4LJR2_EUTSA|nr:eukaryotic translation initiation factor 2 subunit beta [Eutrema salsugineum]ESQ40013.1 hypothetical protein EUTSA_v10014626mg [Eutrema salsugineum]